MDLMSNCKLERFKETEQSSPHLRKEIGKVPIIYQGFEKNDSHEQEITCTNRCCLQHSLRRVISLAKRVHRVTEKQLCYIDAATPTFNPWFPKVLQLPTTVITTHATSTQKDCHICDFWNHKRGKKCWKGL
jgi:hypothetical protein